jgi:hypothetical protein
MKAKRWGFMALAAVLALVMLWGCQAIKPEEPEARSYNTPCYQEQGGGRWVCGSGGELAVLAGGTLDVAGTADFTGATVTGFAPSSIDSNVTVTGNLVVSGSTTSVGTITGDLTGDVTGDLTGDVTGNVTGDVTGTLTGNVTGDLTGNVSGATYVTSTNLAGDLTGNVTGDVTGNVTGDLTGNVSGATYVTSTNLAGDLTGNVTGDVTGNVIGYAYYGRAVSTSGDYTFTQATSGVTLINFGATDEITVTLPDVSLSTVGYQYCIYVYSAYTVTIKPATGDQIHALTNAAGDRIQNVGTVGDSICLLNITSADWAPMQEVGTWSDVD